MPKDNMIEITASGKKTMYADLADLPENERIRIIGEYAAAGKIIAIAIDDDSRKIKRYIKKITRRFPGVRHIVTTRGLVPGTKLVSVGPIAKH